MVPVGRNPSEGLKHWVKEAFPDGSIMIGIAIPGEHVPSCGIAPCVSMHSYGTIKHGVDAIHPVG